MADMVKINKVSIREGDILLGVGLLSLFVIGLTFQTATTEAAGQAVKDTTVWELFWGTLNQLPGMFTGSVHVSDLPRLLTGWGIEAFYYLCITGHKRLKRVTEGHHPWAIFSLDVLAMGCVGYCWYTDWQYASQLIPNLWGVLIFTALVSACVAYCGVAGWDHIKSGFGH